MGNSATRTVRRKKTDFDYFDALTPEFRRVASNSAGNYDSKWFYDHMKAGRPAKEIAAMVRRTEAESFLTPVKVKQGFKWIAQQAPMAVHKVLPLYNAAAAPEYA